LNRLAVLSPELNSYTRCKRVVNSTTSLFDCAPKRAAEIKPFRKTLRRRSFSLPVAVLLSFIMQDAITAAPEPPTIMRDTHLVENSEFLAPYIPALRTSNDGRVAMEVEDGRLNFYLLTPEKLSDRWHSSTPGTSQILAEQSPFKVNHNPLPNRFYAHQTLCESTGAFSTSDSDANPRLCGANGENDCYDLTHIGWLSRATPDETNRLWGTPITVEVSNPKTPQAKIVDVKVGETTAGAEMPSPFLWEIATTSDGRLLVGRIGYLTMSFINARTGREVTGRYGTVYSMLEDGADACDVTQWKRYFPVAHAPYDPRVNERYGFAAFPFRTGEGEFISETSNIGGTYPWIDREGNNLFMTTLTSSLAEQSSAYPNRCVPGTDCLTRENHDRLKGNAVLGLWTQGKLVHFDNMLNNTDWGLPVDPDGHRLVTMYEARDGSAVEARAGSGGRFKTRDYPNLKGRTNNTAIMDSVQTLFNHDPELVQRHARDVVWHMSNGKASDELVFDDYLNPDGFIVSSMMASLSGTGTRYQDGFVRGSGFSADVHLQNAATALPNRWRIPPFGLVRSGTGRVEPIASGGINGRGFWLDGSNEIRYDIEDQPSDPADSDWYVSLFVDSRFDDDSSRRELIGYPDGTHLALAGRSSLLFMRNDDVLEQFELPVSLPSAGWAHLGFNLRNQNRDIDIFLNGFLAGSIRIDSGFFTLTAGALIVGGGDGFRGWIDDFKIFAQNASHELACNYAGGSLIGINDNSEWNQVAASFPRTSHQSINELVANSGRATSANYACHTNYQNPDAFDVHSPPTGTVSIREAINFPEGPVVHDKPRPDSTANTFCLSCHHADSSGGLTLEALVFKPQLTATDDPRRQPSQHLRKVHGNIPAGWLEGKVTEAVQAGSEGFLLDPVLLTRTRPELPSEPPIAGFSQTSVTVNEGVGQLTLTVALSRAADEQSSVYFSTNGGSAVAGSDFYGYSELLVFENGEREKSVTITIVDDFVQEDGETFIGRLFNNDGVELGQAEQEIQINDDDDGSVTLVSVESIQVSEADGKAMVPVTLSSSATTPVSVYIATQPDGAINRSDYYGLYEIVEFEPGETRKTVSVTILNDTESEVDEQFRIAIFNPVGAALGTARGTVTIDSDE